ncbi:MAG: hypothetical protein ACYC40_02165 [Patescibacteria group bacterium]
MLENDSQDLDSNSSVFKNIPRKQKIAVFALAIGAIVIIVFWAWEFNNRLTSPFASSSDKKTNLSSNTASTTAVDMTTDTDHDGLTDYEETNIYHTSPYLADTDSDGIPDGTEVKNGTDPNCPTGKVCNGTDNANIVASSTVDSFNASSSASSIPALSLPTDMASGSQQILQNTLDGKADAATLRALLITSGADKAMLDQISDADLMKSYQETLQNKQ